MTAHPSTVLLLTALIVRTRERDAMRAVALAARGERERWYTAYQRDVILKDETEESEVMDESEVKVGKTYMYASHPVKVTAKNGEKCVVRLTPDDTRGAYLNLSAADLSPMTADDKTPESVNTAGAMTGDEEVALGYVVQEAIATYTSVETGELFFSANYEAIGAHVNSLLSARNSDLERLQAENTRLQARVAELEGRQITPQVQAVWDEYQAMKETESARYVMNSMPDLRSDLWHAFVVMMTEG